MTLMNLSKRAPEDLPDDVYDVRGWEVRTEIDREEVGKVDDMLVDEGDRPRYLDVRLSSPRRHVLVPLSEAHADPSARVIWVHGLDRTMVEELPEYGGDAALLSAAYEQRLQQEYRALGLGRAPAERTNGDAPPLARLGDIGEYRVAKGVTDPRGWKVSVADGQVIGEVKELIVDPAGLTTRYLDCEIKEDKLGLEPLNRHVLIPPEHVRLDRKGKRVVIAGLLARDLRDYPVYQGLPLGADARRAIDEVFGRAGDVSARDTATTRFFGVRTRAEGDAVPAPARSRGRPMVDPTLDEEVELEEELSEETYDIVGESENVRIRVRGDDIIIERRPREGRDDG